MKAALFALALLVASGSGARAQVQPACPGDVPHAATREQVEYDSGGRTVRGLIYRPRSPNGAGVVLLHGARGLGADAARFDPHAIQLASRGYHVLVPNYYDARPGRERRSGSDMRVWRRAAADGAAFLGGQPGADPARIASWGYSLGGFLSGEATMESGNLAAAVSLAGGTDVGEPGRARREVPILLIHARRDPVISPASTRQWGEGLSRRGAAVEVHELDWDGHGFDGPTWCAIFEASGAFLDRTVGARR
ncbi:MAG: hypothetical protein A2623_12510 [Caulobacterales bacterium RIFCSPHIGHO2_01_FULL_70_19]|nr:MAG: hypothetical protein A2623_12510 [Caulobacterales bacterium RIFCSPHIGHO2_01_FULL_70_19]